MMSVLIGLIMTVAGIVGFVFFIWSLTKQYFKWAVITGGVVLLHSAVLSFLFLTHFVIGVII
ncbi:hypothetical protein ABEW34_21595 [Paenibacillus algorifonticola]|uniref:hypothetical protein n=1 Tax=Paenibacillus algorifonticola TaxID=684063 RepID=UPI003D296526